VKLVDILRPLEPARPTRARIVEFDMERRSTGRWCDGCAIRKWHNEFYKSNKKFCKQCVRSRVKANRARNIAHYRAFDRARASDPMRVARRDEYRRTPRGKAAHDRAVRRYRSTKKAAYHAHIILGNAVYRGQVTPWPVCAVPQCDRSDVHGHHADYDNPLGVTWLCPKHHKQAHALLKDAE